MQPWHRLPHKMVLRRSKWAFGTAALETEDLKELYPLPGLSQGPFVVGLLKVKEQHGYQSVAPVAVSH